MVPRPGPSSRPSPTKSGEDGGCCGEERLGVGIVEQPVRAAGLLRADHRDPERGLADPLNGPGSPIATPLTLAGTSSPMHLLYRWRCNLGQVDAGQLHRLGRRLLALSRAASGQAGDLVLVPGQEAVLEDLLRHPDSTVSDIRDRTGFTQSHVSASVARLRDYGLIRGAGDPSDGRRTRLRATGTATQAISNRAGRSIDTAITAAVATPEQAGRVLDLLDELCHALHTTPTSPTPTDRD